MPSPPSKKESFDLQMVTPTVQDRISNRNEIQGEKNCQETVLKILNLIVVVVEMATNQKKLPVNETHQTEITMLQSGNTVRSVQNQNPTNNTSHQNGKNAKKEIDSNRIVIINQNLVPVRVRNQNQGNDLSFHNREWSELNQDHPQIRIPIQDQIPTKNLLPVEIGGHQGSK